MKVKWLDRTLINGPYLCLCKTEEELKAVFEHFNVSFDNTCFPPEGGAHTLSFVAECDEPCTVVFIGDVGTRNEAEVAAMLAHEASHVLDVFLQYIGEEKPSSKFKAYSLQSITERLLTDYKRKRKT
jgi:hypothetical protein